MTILVPSKDSAKEQITNQCRELAALITRYTRAKGDGFHRTAINWLDFARESAVSTTLPGVSAPMAIVVQGKKAALLGEETYCYGAAQYLILSVDLPISGFIN